MAQADVWRQPTAHSGRKSGLKVYNSLTKTKVDFEPRQDNKVTWYNCGPTVYDASHMGHARNYVSQDILRRIMRDYFAYDVQFVMNVTDIDDKIIERARQEHLLGNFLASSNSITQELVDEVQSAFDAFFAKNLGQLVGGMSYADVARRLKTDGAWRKELIVQEEKSGMWLDALSTSAAAIAKAQDALSSGEATTKEDAAALIDASTDPLAKHLDKLHGATITDPSLSQKLARKWEASFFDDMAQLGVERPDSLTRVTEFLDEIVGFVRRIVENGFAYEAGGSVYFDVAKFDGAKGGVATKGKEKAEAWQHSYAKLQPGSKANLALLNSGEGALSSHQGKRSSADFALWKASKPGEPAWPSPWGDGRPGWHIECSVMASAILGDGMDIHSGGVDLMFPHHDNEMAQSEAYHDCPQWVNYFLHTGHLHIEGLKMSKSLKNFITIQDALKRYTPRQLRLSFLAQRWDLPMDFAESAMTEVKNQEATFHNFFAVVKALEYEAWFAEDTSAGGTAHPDPDLLQHLERAKASFRSALSDSFNTPEAMQSLLSLINEANKVLKSARADEGVRVAAGEAARWIDGMVRMLGLSEGVPKYIGERQLLGWLYIDDEEEVVKEAMRWSRFRDAVRTASRKGASSDDILAICDSTTAAADGPNRDYLEPNRRVWEAFRDGVKGLAQKGEPAKAVLALCDKVRDQDLVELGIALDDQDDGRALVKLLPAEMLVRAREEKASAAREKGERQQAAAAAAEAKKRERLEKGKLSPADMFRTAEYSKWDEDGVPTHDGQGQEVAKARRKKLVKEHEAQKRLHAEYLQR